MAQQRASVGMLVLVGLLGMFFTLPEKKPEVIHPWEEQGSNK